MMVDSTIMLPMVFSWWFPVGLHLLVCVVAQLPFNLGMTFISMPLVLLQKLTCCIFTQEFIRTPAKTNFRHHDGRRLLCHSASALRDEKTEFMEWGFEELWSAPLQKVVLGTFKIITTRQTNAIRLLWCQGKWKQAGPLSSFYTQKCRELLDSGTCPVCAARCTHCVGSWTPLWEHFAQQCCSYLSWELLPWAAVTEKSACTREEPLSCLFQGP